MLRLDETATTAMAASKTSAIPSQTGGRPAALMARRSSTPMRPVPASCAVSHQHTGMMHRLPGLSAAHRIGHCGGRLLAPRRCQARASAVRRCTGPPLMPPRSNCNHAFLAPSARVGGSCDFAGAVPGQEAIHVLDPPRTVILVKHRADTVRHPLRVACIHVELAQNPAALIGDGDGYLDRPW